MPSVSIPAVLAAIATGALASALAGDNMLKGAAFGALGFLGVKWIGY